MARRTHARTQPKAPRRSRRSPAIAAAVAGLAFGVGALCSGVFGGDEASSEQGARPQGAQGKQTARPERRPTLASSRIAPGVLDKEGLAAGVTAQVTPAGEAQPEHAEGATAEPPAAHAGCQHGPGELKSEAEYAQLREDATAVVARGTTAILEALRGNDPAQLSWIAGALLENLDAFSEVELAAGLAALASDDSQDRGLRELTIELLGLSPATDRGEVTRLGDLALDEALDEELRGSAISALRLLARERPDLLRNTRAALLSSAEHATHPWLRADALDGVRSAGASPTQVARLVDYLGDQDVGTRNGAARALADSDLPRRAAVSAALQRALAQETSVAAAATILESALRVGRREAQSLLADLAQAPIVQSSPELTQQVTDYRELLAAGETDPTRVLRAREARVHERLTQ